MSTSLGDQQRLAVITEKIKDWFDQAYKEICEVDPTVLNDPDRIFSCDDLCFELGGNISSVAVPRKRLDKRSTNYKQKYCSVLVCGNASGQIHQPLITFPGVRFNYNPLAGFPEAHFSRSTNGLLDSEIFKLWLEIAFYPAVSHLKKPVVLFMEECKTDLFSLQVSEFCMEYNIILYQMPSYSTHAVQPLDIITLKRLKQAWKEVVMDYQRETLDTPSRRDFAKIFKRAWEQGIEKNALIDGFKASGIYPWDPNQNNLTNQAQGQSHDPTTLTASTSSTFQAADAGDVIVLEEQTVSELKEEPEFPPAVTGETRITHDTDTNDAHPLSQQISFLNDCSFPTPSPTKGSQVRNDFPKLRLSESLDRLLDIVATCGIEKLVLYRTSYDLMKERTDPLEKRFCQLYDQLKNVLMEIDNEKQLKVKDNIECVSRDRDKLVDRDKVVKTRHTHEHSPPPSRRHQEKERVDTSCDDSEMVIAAAFRDFREVAERKRRERAEDKGRDEAEEQQPEVPEQEKATVEANQSHPPTEGWATGKRLLLEEEKDDKKVKKRKRYEREKPFKDSMHVNRISHNKLDSGARAGEASQNILYNYKYI